MTFGLQNFALKILILLIVAGLGLTCSSSRKKWAGKNKASGSMLLRL